MANDLDILVTNGSATQFTDNAIQRFVRQKLTVSVEWNETAGKLIVILYEDGTAKDASAFSNFSISLANSTLTLKEGTATTLNGVAFTTATAAGSGRYEFTISPTGGIPSITVKISASFNNPAVDSTPAATITKLYDYHFMAGHLTDRFDAVGFATGFPFK